MVLLQETYKSGLYNFNIPSCLIASFLPAVLRLVGYVCFLNRAVWIHSVALHTVTRDILAMVLHVYYPLSHDWA